MINSDTGSELTKQYNFTYKSKCADCKNAMNQMALLQINLLHEDGLNILVLEAKQIPSDNHTEISISFIFELNNRDILAKIVEKFDVFILYLDSLSQM
jgi:hypothetical protein